MLRSGFIRSCLVIAALASHGSLAAWARADGPDTPSPLVGRIHIPAVRMSEVFPPGTDLISWPIAEFDRLVEAAERRQSLSRSEPARVVRALHRLRWTPEGISGESRFELSADTDPTVPVPLEPWTPAIDAIPSGLGEGQIRFASDGRMALWPPAGGAAPGPIRWHQPPRQGSSAKMFELGLPQCDLATIELDLPTDIVPAAGKLSWLGPDPSELPGHARWRWHGSMSEKAIPLNLRDAADAQHPSPLWIRGDTRIEVRQAAIYDCRWTIDAGSSPFRLLECDIDPSLELLDITGPAVEGYSVEPGSPSRLRIRFIPEVAGPAEVAIRAVATVPGEGIWRVPGFVLHDAVWTGGRTEIHLDRSRELQTERLLSAHALRPEPPTAVEGSESDIGIRLVYETTSAGSPAEFVFRKPAPHAGVEVQGRIALGTGAPRLESRLTWSVDSLEGGGSGSLRPFSLRTDLPPGWTVESLSLSGSPGEVAWQTEPRAGGGVRLLVPVPPTRDIQGSITLDIVAVHAGRSAEESGESSPSLSLPRVVPADDRVVDERWMVSVPTEFDIRPEQVSGLCWIDPATVGLMLPGSESEESTLAWRWIDPSGTGSIRLVSRPRLPLYRLFETVRVTSQELVMDVRLEVDASDTPLGSVSVGWNRTSLLPDSWWLEGPRTGGPEPVLRPAAPPPEAPSPSPSDAIQWTQIVLPAPRTGRFVLRASGRIPWAEVIELPVPTLPVQGPSDVTLLVGLDPTYRSTVQATSLRRLDAGIVRNGMAEEVATAFALDRDSRTRWAYAFGAPNLAAGNPSIRLRTEKLELTGAEGIIREAILTSRLNDSAGAVLDLLLEVLPATARELRIALPEVARLERSHVDGRPFPLSLDGTTVVVPLPPSGPGRAGCVVGLTYSIPEFQTGDPIPSYSPQFSLPCLGLTLELEASQPMTVIERDPTLVDPRPVSALDPMSRWLTLSRRPVSPARSSLLDPEQRVELDSLISAPGRDGITLGEILLRWDGGRRPIVVDRLAMLGERWTPRTRILFEPMVRNPSSSQPPPASVTQALRSIGLEVVSLGSIVLLTTQDQRPQTGELEAWNAAARTAIRDGSDAHSRLVLATRWVQFDSLGRASVSTNEAQTATGFRSNKLWLERLGWSPFRLRVERVEAYQTVFRRLFAALAVWTVGLGISGWSRRWRVVYLTLIVALALSGLALGDPRVVVLASGLLLGATACLGLWLGRAWSQWRGRSTASTTSGAGSAAAPGTPSGSVSGAIGMGLLLSLTTVLVGAATAGAEAAPSSSAQESVGPVMITERAVGPPAPPVLAILPSEPGAQPTHAWLTRADDARLRAWANDPAAVPSEPTIAWAESATHTITTDPDGKVMVISRFRLWNPDTHHDAFWEAPVGEGRGWSARLDGSPVPVEIRSAPTVQARIRLSGPGTHDLELTRFLDSPTLRPGGVQTIALNPLPITQLACQTPPDWSLELGQGSRAWPVVHADSAAIAVGPVDSLRLAIPNAAAVARTPAVVESLLLWDAVPAGDRLRARLRIRSAIPTSLLRLELPPQVFVRETRLPGLVDSVTDTPAADEAPITWEGRVDPPIVGDCELELDLWRSQTSRERELPRIRLLDASESGYTVVLRRPANWSGDLLTAPGRTEVPVLELPDAWIDSATDVPLVIAGTVTWDGTSSRVELAPLPMPGTLTPTVELTIGEGRIDVVASTRWQRLGLDRELEVQLPAAWRMVSAVAPGLTSWDVNDTGRLRLRFDSEDATPDRSIVLRGWVPIDPSAASGEVVSVGPPVEREYRQPLPWPLWQGLKIEPGTLVLNAPTGSRATIEGPAGSLAGGEAALTSTTSGLSQVAYPITVDPSLLALRWEEPSLRTQVDVRSILTLYPAEAELTAVLRYQASGGPLRHVVLSLPDDWAQSAHVEVPGRSTRIETTSLEGATYWTIRADDPVWGDETVRVRATWTYPPGRQGTFPALLPRGRGGAVRTALLLINATGRPIVTEGSGITPVQPQSLGVDPRHPRPAVGAPVEAFTPVADSWRLAFRLEADPDPERDDTLRTKVDLASVACAISPEGTFWGQSDYELAPRPGSFLAIGVPAEVEPLLATVDGTPTRLLHGRDRAVLVPLSGPPPRRVGLVWRVENPIRRTDGSWRTALPVPLSSHQVPTAVTVRAPAGVRSWVTSAGFNVIGATVVPLRHAEALTRQLLAGIDTLDRSSLPLESALVSDLIQFELLSRGTDRTIQFELARRARTAPSLEAKQEAVDSREQLSQLRAQIEQAVRLAGLDPLLASARIRAGVARGTDPRPELTTPVIGAGGLRLRLLGEPLRFWSDGLQQGQGLELGARGNNTPLWTQVDLPLTARYPALWGPRVRIGDQLVTASLALVVIGALVVIIRYAPRVPYRFATVGFLLLLLGLAGMGSACALAGLLGLIIGWLSGPVSA